MPAPRTAPLLPVAMAVALAATAAARAEIGLRDAFDAELRQRGAGVPGTTAQGAQASGLHEENLRLQRQVQHLRESVRQLTESLTVAHRETEMNREQFREAKLRLEALGLEAIGGDKGKLEQRLLHAVNDLRLERERAKRLEVQIENLLVALQPLLQRVGGVDPQIRAAVEAEIRQAAHLAAGGSPETAGQEPYRASLRDGRIISVKQEWSLVVANVGSRHGVKLGMPFRVLREDKPLAEVRVVDVRESISGAIIQEQVSEKEAIRVGDRLRIDAKL